MFPQNIAASIKSAVRYALPYKVTPRRKACMMTLLPAHIPGRMIGRQSPVMVTVSGIDYEDPYAVQTSIVRSFAKYAREHGNVNDWSYAADRIDGYRAVYVFDGAEIVRRTVYRPNLNPSAILADMYPGFTPEPDEEGNGRKKAINGTGKDNSTYARKVLATALGIDGGSVAWRKQGFPLPDDLSTLVGKPGLKSLDKVRDMIARASLPHVSGSVTTTPGHLVRPGKQHTGVYQGNSHNN